MAYEQTGDGFGANEWVTIKGPDVYHFLSDGTCLQLIADDHDTPSYWRVDHVDTDGVVTVPHPDHFPMRAGGLEWCRAWIAKAGLKTVPTDEQKAAPWYQFRRGGEFEQDRARQLRTPIGRKSQPTLDDAITGANLAADVQRAVEMAQAIDMAMKIDIAMKAPPETEAQRMAREIDAMMKAAAAPSYSCPHCRSSFGTPVCPECGGVAVRI